MDFGTILHKTAFVLSGDPSSLYSKENLRHLQRVRKLPDNTVSSLEITINAKVHRKYRCESCVQRRGESISPGKLPCPMESIEDCAKSMNYAHSIVGGITPAHMWSNTAVITYNS